MTNPLPTEVLEQRAAEQRRRIHDTVTELRATVKAEVRERLNVRRMAREHLWPAAGVASLVALIAGYGLGGIVRK